MYTYIYIYTHTYIHTYLHTYMYTYSLPPPTCSALPSALCRRSRSGEGAGRQGIRAPPCKQRLWSKAAPCRPMSRKELCPSVPRRLCPSSRASDPPSPPSASTATGPLSPEWHSSGRDGGGLSAGGFKKSIVGMGGSTLSVVQRTCYIISEFVFAKRYDFGCNFCFARLTWQSREGGRGE